MVRAHLGFSVVLLSAIAGLFCVGPISAAESASGAWSSKFPLPPGANGPVMAMATVGSNLYVGGAFTEIGGVHARTLAKFDGQTWSEVGGGVARPGYAYVSALVADRTNL